MAVVKLPQFYYVFTTFDEHDLPRFATICDFGPFFESSVAWVGDSTPLITNNN